MQVPGCLCGLWPNSFLPTDIPGSFRLHKYNVGELKKNYPVSGFCNLDKIEQTEPY
jgi:hypothetical protein